MSNVTEVMPNATEMQLIKPNESLAKTPPPAKKVAKIDEEKLKSIDSSFLRDLILERSKEETKMQIIGRLSSIKNFLKEGQFEQAKACLS